MSDSQNPAELLFLYFQDRSAILYSPKYRQNPLKYLSKTLFVSKLLLIFEIREICEICVKENFRNLNQLFMPCAYRPFTIVLVLDFAKG